MSKIDGSAEQSSSAEGAMGIVVQGGAWKEQRPKAVAFVWGGKVRRKPTLPYGRWKGQVRPAA